MAPWLHLTPLAKISRPKRVRLRRVAQEQVAITLVGIGGAGFVFNLDQSGKDGLGLIEQGILEGEAAFTVRGEVVLHRPLVEQLFSASERERGKVELSTFSGKATFGFDPGLGRSEMNGNIR